MRSDAMPRLVVLDRDGTLNALRDDFVKTPADWQPLPGALEAVARLTQAGCLVVLAINQSGLARGLLEMHDLNDVHAAMNVALARLGARVDAVFFCPHAADEGCDCRKPQPGLIRDIAARYGVPLAKLPMVGDGLRDLQAAAACGAQPHLVRTGLSAALGDDDLVRLHALVPGLQVHADLAAFVDHWLAGLADP
jgi:D-glycero-D-manno-heptose 1,7-bisphosphate phosphatase